MVFNATFNNISVISWWWVVLVGETGENHRPVASHWQTLSHNVVHLALQRTDSDTENYRSIMTTDKIVNKKKYRGHDNSLDFFYKGPSWPWSYGSWIYNYLCNQCLSPLMLWVRMVFNATFNNMSVISWWWVVLVGETGENHRPVESH
jgi:hypothetical protein